MSIHLVRLPNTEEEKQFHFLGSVNPVLEQMILNTINHFYDVTGCLYAGKTTPVVYKVYLDEKGGNNFQKNDQIHLNPRKLTEWTVTHELAHALDAAFGWALSKMLREQTGSGFLSKALHIARPDWRLFWYRVGSPPPPCGIDRNFNALEDFAETVTAFIFPEEAYRRAAARGYPYEKWGYTNFHATPRGKFLADLIESKKQTALLS